jgi:lysophospholipase L1-like esterase
MRISVLATVAFAAALFGCGSGCDGERPRANTTSRVTTTAPATGASAALPAPTASPAVAELAAAPEQLGALDAPDTTLDGLFTGLAAAESGNATGRVLMLFFGDSHTAGDSMTSRLRTVWQNRFGDAGRGLVGAGRPPTKHYYQRDVRYGSEGDWHAMVGGHRGDNEPFGIGGIRVTGSHKGARLWVESCGDCPGGKVAQFEILYYAAPDHGVLRYRIDDGTWTTLSTKTAPIEPPHPAREVVPVPEGAHRLTIEHGGGGVLDLFGVALERHAPGVIVDSLGVVGRRLGSLRSWDWSVIGEQLATRDPRLVVLQYGTNEADDPDLNLDDLARYYDETILRIRAAAPTASVLILGPPDLGVREGGHNCDHAKPTADGGVIPECEWRTPEVLREIVAVEHAAAARNRVAFFDTLAAMGGIDQMDSWFHAEPKVAFKDRTHFTDIGYQRWADALTATLLERYEHWRTAHALPPTRPASEPASPAPTSDAALPGAAMP